MRLRLSAANRRAELEIDPACGGRIEQIRLQPENSSAPLPILQAEERSPESSRKSCSGGGFNGHILLPFNDRIPGGRYLWEGTEHRLPVNEPNGRDAIHGFLYRLPMEYGTFDSSLSGKPQSAATSKTMEATAELSAEITPETARGYPFHLSVRITYRLRFDRFFLEMEVRNTGGGAAPLAFGWHPYFHLPASQTIDRYHLLVPSDYYVEVDSTLLPTGRTPSVEESSYDFRSPTGLGGADLDIAVHKTALPLVIANESYRLELESSEAFPYWQLFTAPDRRSIAVEAVSAATDAFNRPSLGLKRLEPGETLRGRIGVSLCA